MNDKAAEKDLRLTLAVLLVVYVFNFLDRQIVTILAEPIARDLDLSDTQIGVLTGLAFALFYTAMGVPIARIADNPHTNRATVIAVSLAIWSAMTALCGLAQNFSHLLLARFGVGVGEAGGTPPSHSLITDKAPPEKRASAFGIYQLGPPIGGLIGMVLGGVLADSVGWRHAFLLVGLPGLLLALVVRWLVKDPRMSRAATQVEQGRTQALAIRKAGKAIECGHLHWRVGNICPGFHARFIATKCARLNCRAPKPQRYVAPVGAPFGKALRLRSARFPYHKGWAIPDHR